MQQRLWAASRRLHVAFLIWAPIVFAAFALAMGKKTGWDFYNYHWYNPYALLNGRFGFDVAVGHNASYYNPLADVPLYLLASYGPSWLGGLFLGAMTGLTVALIGVLGIQVLPYENSRRVWLAALLAFAGAMGAGAFQEIGDPANDVPAGIGILVALIAIVPDLRDRVERGLSSTKLRYLLAGLAAGAAIALKLTTAVYAVGIALALLCVGRSIKDRMARAVVFGAGTALGLCIVGGFWMWELWRYSGNPFFPYFNDVFRSDLLPAESFRDRNFAPRSVLEWLIFPAYFTRDSHKVSESSFRDAHVLILYVLIPMTLALPFFLRNKLRMRPAAAVFLLSFAIFSYLAWLFMFDIYRYLIPLEMLAPLLTMLALSLWPLPRATQLSAAILLLVIAQLLVRIDVSDRQTWAGPYVAVTPPKIEKPRETLVVMTGHAPMSYVIPFFPKQIPFLRIDGWLVGAGDRDSGLARAMRRRVAQHDGPIFALFEAGEAEGAKTATAAYDLTLAIDPDFRGDHCDLVRSNINQPLVLCAAMKRSVAQGE